MKIFTILCSFALPLLALSTLVNANAADKPNLIVIMADDLGYGDLGCTGSSQIKTPAIDKLAREGVFCSRAYVTAPMCAPSRMGMLTGRFPKRYGITTNPNTQSDYIEESVYGLPKGETLLPQILKPHGYVSGITGKWHLGHTAGQHPTDRGFDAWWGFLGGSRYYFPHKPEAKGLNPSAIVSNYTGKLDVTYLTDDITRESVEFIKQRKKDGKPFFLFVSYNAPHWPFQALEEDLELYSHIKNKERRTYCAMIHALDRGVAQITSALEQTGAARNTMVVFLSDNGGAYPHAPSCNAPFRGEKRLHYEGGVRVPFIVKYPAANIPAGSRCDQVVSAVDIIPTLLGRAGIAAPGSLDGEDMLPYLKNNKLRKARTLYWCTDYTSAILHGDVKYLLVPSLPPQMYNINADPTESQNLYTDAKGIKESIPYAKKLGHYLGNTPAMRYPDSIKWSSELLEHYNNARVHKQPAKE